MDENVRVFRQWSGVPAHDVRSQVPAHDVHPPRNDMSLAVRVAH